MEIQNLRGKNYGVEHLLAESDTSLLETLVYQMKLNPSEIHFLLSFGSIYVNGQRCLENMQIAKGTYVRVHQRPRRFPVEHFHWPEQKIFEDADFLVINKPSGLPVHPTVDNVQENLACLISEKIKAPIYVTHRLDVATSGLLIFAKSKEAQTRFNQTLMLGEARKYYRALVHGTHLPEGEWVHHMQPSPRAPKVVSSEARPGWATCRLKVLDQTEVFTGHSEVLIELITGRTHQIRAQLSAEGFPIVGDQAYGSPVALADFEKICLQAFFLEAPLAQNEKKSFRLELPPWREGSQMPFVALHS